VADNDGFGSWLGSHPATLDAAIAALVLATFEMPAFDPYRHDGGAWWALWGVLVAGPLLWRRRAPTAALVVSLVGALGASVTRAGPNWGILSQVTILLGPSVALASAATILVWRSSRRLAMASGAVIVLAARASLSSPDAVAAQVALIAGAWLTGEAVRARRHEIALLHELVARRAEQATDDERNRIARELHDVVAHQLSVIAIHAGAARIAAGESSPNNESLATIEEASRQALADVRRALGILRNDDGPGGLAPQPGLDQLDRLANRLRDAGLPLDVTTAGDLSVIPDGIARSAYRIVQEALTNVVNHAGRVATTVRVVCTPVEVELDVRNDRPISNAAALPDGGGRGIVGMRERVAAYGGSFQARPLPSGGFVVTARIPLP
jgi:signal transduction histidine kinase